MDTDSEAFAAKVEQLFLQPRSHIKLPSLMRLVMHEFCEYLQYTGVPESDAPMAEFDSDDPAMQGLENA